MEKEIPIQDSVNHQACACRVIGRLRHTSIVAGMKVTACRHWIKYYARQGPKLGMHVYAYSHTCFPII